MKEIYVSCPVSIPETYLNKICSSIEGISENAIVTAWDRYGKYEEDFVETCDAIVIAHPKNQFVYDFNSLPSGVRNEVAKAIHLRKKLYGCYEKKDGSIEFYEISHVGNSISLNKGTSNSLFEFCNNKSQNSYDSLYSSYEEKKNVEKYLSERKVVLEKKIKEELSHKNITSIKDEEFLLLLR